METRLATEKSRESSSGYLLPASLATPHMRRDAAARRAAGHGAGSLHPPPPFAPTVAHTRTMDSSSKQPVRSPIHPSPVCPQLEDPQ